MIHFLIISNALIFFIELQWPDRFLPLFALWPLSSGRFQPWQLLSYAFLHGGLAHLMFNMYALWLFGTRLERAWGPLNLLRYYLVCVMGAALMQLGITALNGAIYPTIGASGGVYGILLAFGMTYPNDRLLLVFPPVLIKAKWLVIIFGIIELVSGVTGSHAGVAHFAHLGGMVSGLLMILHWRRNPPSRYS